MSMESMKRLEGLVHDQGEPGDSTMMFSREGKAGPETMTICVDTSGHVEQVTYCLEEPDGSQVMIQGNQAIVASPGEKDLRCYELSPAGPDISYQERLRADLFGEPSRAEIESDLAMIKGALRTFQLAQESPEGFRKKGLFEDLA